MNEATHDLHADLISRRQEAHAKEATAALDHELDTVAYNKDMAAALDRCIRALASGE